MAQPADFLSEDQFTCSICLDVFNNPVSTPCGHSFCQVCICSYWDRNSSGSGRSARPYQCPLCKESYRKRPELHINRTLKEITERFKTFSDPGLPTDGTGSRTGDPSANTHHQQHHVVLSPSHRPRDMPDGVFAEMMRLFQQMPANSLPQPRDEHLDPPPPYTPHRRYTVSSPGDVSPDLPLCPLHLRGLEFFCRSDNNCVCRDCLEIGEHQGHSIIPAKREWNIKKSQLGITEVELKDLISEKETKVEEIQKSLREIQAAAEKETDGAVCVFSELVSSVERCQAGVLEVIEMTRRAAERRAQSLLRALEEEISELKRRRTALSQLVLSEDYIHFLKTYSALSTPPQGKDWSGVTLTSDLTSGKILRTVNQMVAQLQDEMKKLPEVCQRPSVDQSVPRSSHKTRRVQEYADDITLDPHTSHPRLILSVDGKHVSCGERNQPVADNPERFDRVVCVLARQGFTSGRHYWEVVVGEKTDWDLGVASRSVNRKGKITVSPAHGYWFLSLRDSNNYSFRTEPSTSLTVSPRPSRIGIYVDYDKGLVSFYNVEARVLIYTFTDSFSDTIHPFFSPCTNKSGRNEGPLSICPVTMAE